MLTHDGFDPRRHPLSLLSLDELGWIQITNFVVAGLLFVASAVGMRRVLHPGRGTTWGPLLIGVLRSRSDHGPGSLSLTRPSASHLGHRRAPLTRRTDTAGSSNAEIEPASST